MKITWILAKNEKITEKEVILTENSFKNVMNVLDSARSDGYIQINDPKFDDGMAEFCRKDLIIGYRCPAAALMKCTGGEKE